MGRQLRGARAGRREPQGRRPGGARAPASASGSRARGAAAGRAGAELGEELAARAAGGPCDLPPVSLWAARGGCCAEVT